MAPPLSHKKRGRGRPPVTEPYADWIEQYVNSQHKDLPTVHALREQLIIHVQGVTGDPDWSVDEATVRRHLKRHGIKLKLPLAKPKTLSPQSKKNRTNWCRRFLKSTVARKRLIFTDGSLASWNHILGYRKVRQ